jgi:hypothetical protein
LPTATITTEKDSTTVQTDSTWTKETNRPQVIFLPGDTVRIEKFIECDKVTNKPKDMNAKLRGKNSELDVSLKNGILKITSKYDSAIRVINTKDKEIHTLRKTIIEVNSKEKEVQIKIEYKTHWYDPYCRGTVLALIVALITYLILKLKKLFL